MTEPNAKLPDLDPAAAALLAAYRRGRAMPPAARARVWERIDRPAPRAHVLSDRFGPAAWATAFALAAALALWLVRGTPTAVERAPATATLSADRVAASASEAARSGKAGPRSPASATHGAALDPGSATNAAAVGDVASATHGAALDPGSATNAAAVVDVASATTTITAVPVDSAVTATSTHTTAVDRATRADAAPRAARSSARARDAVQPSPAPVAPADPAPTASDLRAEQLLLARGWQALADGRIADARRDADEHARRFPAGVLEPERRALAAAATCADDLERGRALARVFLADHPRSPLARRLRDACAVGP